jgi:hypothetical protein
VLQIKSGIWQYQWWQELQIYCFARTEMNLFYLIDPYYTWRAMLAFDHPSFSVKTNKQKMDKHESG